jgi:hypothetical protein
MQLSSKENSNPDKDQSALVEKEAHQASIPRMMISFKNLNEFNNLNLDQAKGSPKDEFK